MIDVEFDINKERAIKTIVKFQNGKNISPAIRELIQNSIDAGATHVDVLIRKKYSMVSDNGRGMSKDEIINTFRVLFETDKNDDSIGVFGIGRTQIMNFGKSVWITKNHSIYVDIENYLGFKLNERKQMFNGTKMICVYNKPLELWDIYSLERGIKKLALPFGVSIEVNGDKLDYNSYIVNSIFTDKNFTVFKSPQTESYIYNMGIMIKRFASNFDYCINSNRKMEVNFARNELLETDPIVQDLYAKIREVETLMVKDKETFDLYDCKKIMSLISVDKIDFNKMVNKYIIPGIKRRYSFNELVGFEVFFGDDDVWSRDCCNQGMIVLNKEIEEHMKIVLKKTGYDIRTNPKSPSEISTRGYHKDFEVENIRRNKFYGYIPHEMNDRIFDKLQEDMGDDKIKIHIGNSDISVIWGEDGNIHIDKLIIEQVTSYQQAVIEIWQIMCMAYAHRGYDFKMSYDDFKLPNKEYYDDNFYYYFELYSKNSMPFLIDFLNNVSLKYIKAKYFGN